jgi:hypothetical protein
VHRFDLAILDVLVGAGVFGKVFAMVASWRLIGIVFVSGIFLNLLVVQNQNGSVGVVFAARVRDVERAASDRQRVRFPAAHGPDAIIVKHCSLAEIAQDHALASFKNGMIDRDQIVRRAWKDRILPPS